MNNYPFDCRLYNKEDFDLNGLIFSKDKGDFDAVKDTGLLIEAVRVKLQRTKHNLRHSVGKWRKDSDIEGQHTNLREKGDSFFLKKDYNKALHCYR